MLAFVVRELTYLKLLQPIMEEMTRRGCSFVLYIMDSYKSEKEYNRPNKARVIKSFGHSVDHLIAFGDDGALLYLLKCNKIDRVVSVEMGLWAHQFTRFFKDNKIRTHSVCYLTDSIWRGKSAIEGLDRVYYSSPHIMQVQHMFNGIRFDQNRDRCFGSPIFDQLRAVNNDAVQDTLILLPNGCNKGAFGSNSSFKAILEKFGNSSNLIFKTRHKQWLPDVVKSLAKEIVYDGDCMYPSAISKLYPRTKNTVLFYSSGIYEAVVANQYVVNVQLPLTTWNYDKAKLRYYFESELYNYPDVVNGITQQDVLSGKCKIESVNKQKQQEWINKYVGVDVSKTPSYELIASDVLS